MSLKTLNFEEAASTRAVDVTPWTTTESLTEFLTSKTVGECCQDGLRGSLPSVLKPY